METKLLLIGKYGLISQKIQKHCKLSNTACVSVSMNNQKAKAKTDKDLSNIIEEHRPTHIVNCAAILGSKFCYENPEQAEAINSLLPSRLAEISDHYRIKLFQLSSEAVFESNALGQLYDENDEPAPNTVYGSTKRQGEINALKSEKAVIIRLPKIIDRQKQLFAHLIDRLEEGAKIQVANNVYSTPIASDFAAKHIIALAQSRGPLTANKIMHISGNQRLSLYETVVLLAPEIMHKRIIPIPNNLLNPESVEPPFLNGGLRSLANLTSDFAQSIKSFWDS